MTILGAIGIWLSFSLPFGMFMGRILKNCSQLDSAAEIEIKAAKAWSEVHEEDFPINSGL